MDSDLATENISLKAKWSWKLIFTAKSMDEAYSKLVDGLASGIPEGHTIRGATTAAVGRIDLANNLAERIHNEPRLKVDGSVLTGPQNMFLAGSNWGMTALSFWIDEAF